MPGICSYFEVDDFEKFISNCLPSVFYETEAKVISKNILKLERLSWAFHDVSEFEQIFLINRLDKILASQHGVGYLPFDS